MHLQPPFSAQGFRVRDELLRANVSAFSSSVQAEKMISVSWLMGREEM